MRFSVIRSINTPQLFESQILGHLASAGGISPGRKGISEIKSAIHLKCEGDIIAAAMEIICDKCQSRFKIADARIPADRVASLPCPKCKNKISVGRGKQKAPSLDIGLTSDNYDASDKPFDFVEEEGKTALICESNSAFVKKIMDALNLMEYHITVAESGRDALKKMRYHQYDLILVNEAYNCDGIDSNMVLLYLERLNMSIRRNIYVGLISNSFRTMDQMMAFRYSVNIIINTKNISDVGKIIRRGLTDHELFYRIYNETLKSAGRL